eukprot:129122-Pelagomonas_calceolata.AAC.2
MLLMVVVVVVVAEVLRAAPVWGRDAMAAWTQGLAMAVGAAADGGTVCLGLLLSALGAQVVGRVRSLGAELAVVDACSIGTVGDNGGNVQTQSRKSAKWSRWRWWRPAACKCKVKQVRNGASGGGGGHLQRANAQ